MAEMTRERLDGFREGLKAFGPMEELCDYDDLADFIAAVEELVGALAETDEMLLWGAKRKAKFERLDKNMALLSRYRRNGNG